jgi:hypothetical protein
LAYTLGQAAKAAGVSKTTMRRAIDRGRVSATRREDGSYEIDPAELQRAFPAVPVTPRSGNGSGTMARSVTPSDTGGLRVEVEMLRERLAEKDATIDDLRQRLDRSEDERRQAQERVTALLTDQRPPAERRGWWRRLFGR